MTDEKRNEFILYNLITHGKIQMTTVEITTAMIIREIKKEVIRKNGGDIKIYNRDDGRFFTKIKINNKEKQVSSKSRNDLYKKVYYELFSKSNMTLDELYHEFMIYRRDDTNIKPKTLKENSNDWDNYIKDTEYANMPIGSLKTKHFKRLFEKTVKIKPITKQHAVNIKGLLSKMFVYAIEQEYLEYNPIRELDINRLSYKVNLSKNIYTIEERNKLLNYLQDIIEPYSLAIQLDFQLTARIGEIKALTWDDIDFDNNIITISSQDIIKYDIDDNIHFSSRSYEVENETKGNTADGTRYLYMTKEAKVILLKAKELNPNGEYVFMSQNRKLTTDRFNRRLKDYCDKANVIYKSSHKIRATSCSMIYNGTNLADLSKSMGHTNVNTTLRYINKVKPKPEYNNHIEEALKISAPTCTND